MTTDEKLDRLLNLQQGVMRVIGGLQRQLEGLHRLAGHQQNFNRVLAGMAPQEHASTMAGLTEEAAREIAELEALFRKEPPTDETFSV